MNTHDPLDTEAQDKARKDRNTRDKLAESNEVEDVKWLMGNKRGRRVLWRILDRGDVYRTSFNTNSMTMAFNEGAKAEGRRLLVLLQLHCPEQYQMLLKEANE